jgi:ATP phosphoribosyltransferase
MSRYVENGTIDAGLTGKDWIEENESDVIVVDDLVYSKVSQNPARWVLAVPADSKIRKLQDLEGRKIATELVNFTKKYFKAKGIDVEVEFSWGATEAKVVSGLADAIVEVTETGSSIRAHGLKIIHELMVSHPADYEQASRSMEERKYLFFPSRAIQAGAVHNKMNVPEDRLEEVIRLLPSLRAPTVAGLYKTKWFSIETVVESRIVRELIPDLIKAGAEGIIEYPLNKVI